MCSWVCNYLKILQKIQNFAKIFGSEFPLDRYGDLKKNIFIDFDRKWHVKKIGSDLAETWQKIFRKIEHFQNLGYQIFAGLIQE